MPPMSSLGLSPVRFSSTIRFVPAWRFNRLPLEQMQLTGHYLAPKNSLFSTPSMLMAEKPELAKGYTDGIMMCNAGGVQSPGQMLLFHFYPEKPPVPGISQYDPDLPAEPQRLAQVRERMMQCLARLEKNLNKTRKAAKRPLRAMLIGGESYWKSSREYRDAMVDILKKARVPFSLFWGHVNEARSRFYVSPQKDLWLVNTVFETEYGDQDLQSAADLPRAFEEIEIDRKDTVFVDNRRFKIPKPHFKPRS